ncbi:MAG TPA: fibronectin type III domain-containing protein, partial [Bacteroidales bacterium]|nr:fibronectin type III domain-containing protein [Bacteroidales bacterium]
PSIVTVNNTPPGSLRFQSASASQPTYAITPQMDADINTLMITFQLRAESATSSGVMHVGVMSNPYDTSTFELVQIITPTNTSFQEYEVMFSNTTLTGIGNHIAFKHVTNSSAYYYWLDDVVVEFMPDCPRPSDLAIVSIASDQVEVGWLENGTATSWVVEYKEVTATTWQVENAYANPHTIMNLNPATNYEIRVKADCGTEDSDYSVPLTFTTPCLAVDSFPYTENFDTYGTTTGTFPTCWFRPVLNTSTPYPSIVTAYSVSSPASLRFQSASATVPTYAITPQLDADINTLMVTFQLKAENISSSGVMHVGVMSNPYDLTTFELVQIITPTGTSFEEHEVMFSNTTLTGTGNYIAFKHVTNSSIYYYWLDDVVVDLIPSCPRPADLTSSNVTQTSLDLGWVEYGTATAWEVEYGATGFTQGTGTILAAATNPVLITGLTESTCYDFYVRSVCAPGDESDWSNMATFCTSQTPVSVPFTIDFETASGFTFANNTSGNNWHVGNAADVNNTTGGSNGLYISNDNGVTNAYSNTSCVVWAFRDIYFTPSTDDYTLTFDWKCRGESSFDYFNVYIG